VRLFVPQQPEIIGFTYLDREAGFSAKGGPEGDPQLADRRAITVRLPGFNWQPLAEEEIAHLGLPGVSTVEACRLRPAKTGRAKALNLRLKDLAGVDHGQPVGAARVLKRPEW
jgi:hypothetical protein